jgi:acyl transferase domain-containing protein/acyl carrier protein
MSHDQEIQEAVEGREIAVIGMSGRFPKARDLRQLWRNLCDGVEAVTFFSDEELLAAGIPAERLRDSRYVKAGSVLEEVDGFDAGFFGYSAREAEIMDPQQRLFLEHTWEALEDAGYAPEGYDGLIGVYAGVAWNTYLLSNLTTHRDLFDGGGFQVFITNDKDFMPTKVSYKLNLKGPSVVVQTSCSTSLVAVHLACLSLLSYECDMTLVGGVTVKVPQTEGYYALDGGLASPDGHCRSFDARAAGTIFGSGVGVVTLKRLADALADGDQIRAVIKGSAINNDGSLKVSYTAPSVEGQAEVIALAQFVAGVDADTIGYVEAHGTGTSLGDPIEVTALTKVFRESTRRKGYCALGSIKSNLGHLDAAAGIAGFIKTVLALENRQLPPSLNFETPNPVIDFAESPFFVNTELRGWPAGEAPRRAGVSSFGVGGTNAHVILEEAPAAEAPAESRPWQLLVLSARSEEALDRASENLLGWLREAEDDRLADAAFTLRAGRSVFRHRRTVVCRDRLDAIAALESRDPSRVLSASDAEDQRERPVVFLFPGQGAQHACMARGLYDSEEVFRAELDRCAELLRPHLGQDLRRVLWPEEGERKAAERELTRTALAQPALFAVEYSLARLWMSWDVRPQALLGHSVGEWVAACLAGVLRLEDALRLVAVRGRLMDALPSGAMLGVPLAEEELALLLPEGVSIAAVNEPARCVASGPEAGISKLERVLTDRGVATRRLHTSHAFHSAMMDLAVEPFADEVRKVALKAPEIPFVSNLTGTWITAAQATDRAYWAGHLRQPVRFAAGVAELLSDPRRILLEVGPGRTLTTLAGRHPARTEQAVVTSLGHLRDGTEDQASLLSALGRLWLAGLRLDWSGFHGAERRMRVPLPTYPFERQRYWIEPRKLAALPTEIPSAISGKRPDLADWFWIPSWKPALLSTPQREESPRRWLVFAAPDTPGAGLAQRLARDGREIITVEPSAASGFRRLGETAFAVALGDSGAWEGLLAELWAREKLPEAVVHAWDLGASRPAADDVASFEAAQERGFHALVDLARAMGKVGWAPRELTVVSSGLFALHAGEAVRPELATVLGLCKVLPQEASGVACRAIDAAPPPAGQELALARLLDGLAAEIGAGPAAGEQVAWRGARRWVPCRETVRLSDPGLRDDGAPRPFRDRGVYLLTGGLEGNGHALARYLARTVRARLVLLEEPGTAVDLARVRALEELGAEILVLPVAPGDEAATRAAVARAEERFGAMHGLIHAASTEGERAFRLVRELDRTGCGWNFKPKAHAAYALEKALAGRELEVCILLSSLATELGGVAYAAHTAANCFLDAFAQDRARQGDLPWCSLGWDVWELEDEPGQDQITTVRDDLAGLAMSPREGEEAFRRAAAADGLERLLVSTADLATRIEQSGRRVGMLRERAQAAAPASRHPRPSLSTAYVEPDSDFERRIAEVWQRTLGFEEIGVHDNFFELGGDSFVALQVVSRLQDELGGELSVAKLYQGLTIRSLAALLAKDRNEAAGERAAHLEDRRESMTRRRGFLERRRSQKSEAVENG